jgi:formylglycine-generating enzyme required for sulfatase activity
MGDAPRKAGPWPLLAILLLIGLLSAFLVLQWSKRDAEKVTYKPPPPPPHEPPPPAPTPVPPAPAPVQDPAKEEFEKQIALAKKALEAKKWDEALAALDSAARAKDDPSLRSLREAAEQGKKDEEKAREEERARLVLRRKQEEAFTALQEKVEKLRTDSRWDAALAAIGALAKEFPEALKDAAYERLLDRFRGLRADADGAYTGLMADARKLASEGKHAPALTQAGKALGFYPEREADVRKFGDEVREARLLKEMVRIPSTDCWLGSDAAPDERPLRRKKLPAFLIDRYEVTNEDYAAFVAATNHPAPSHWGPTRRPPPKRERHPVVFVTFADAGKYAAWAGKRLPSAEEWEVAARGPDPREFPWGNAFTEKDNVFNANSLEYWQFNKSQNPGTTPVDQFDGPNSESAFRVMGMGGNVWEWTSTEDSRKFRVLKGGSFMTPKAALRCANVYPEDPALAHPDVGFRCARDLP